MHRLGNIMLRVVVGLIASIAFLATVATVHAQLCSSAVSTGTCFAQATKYAMKLHAFRLSPDGTVANSTPLAATLLNFDVGSAAASAGQQVATWISGAVVPLKTYTHFMVDIDRAATVSGTTTVSGGSCTATDVPATFDIPSSTATTTFTDLGGNQMRVATRDVSGLPLTVDNINDVVSIDIEFNSNLGVMYTVSAGACTSSAVGPMTINKFDLVVTHNHP